MRYLIIACLISVFTFFTPSRSGLEVQKTEAIPALVLAPEAAIAALEIAILTVAAAYALHMITLADKREMTAEIQKLIDTIKEATGAVLHAALESAMFVLQKVSSVKNGMSGGNCIPDRRAKERGAICKDSIDLCCDDFFGKFKDRIEKGRGGIRVYADSRKSKLLCCFEWDRVHGGLEIFDKRGRHQGERGCEDLHDDPCKLTASRGAHAQPAPQTHSPGSPACRP